MDDEAKALADMFPDIPQQTLSSIWRNSRKDFSAAVDEALTLTSLGNDSESAEVLADNFVPSELSSTGELWEDASSVYMASARRPTLRPDTSSLSFSSGYETAVETRRPSSTAGFYLATPGGVATTPGGGEGGAKRLPWEGREAGYVIGSGELGLLNELQMPRRGAVVPLDGDFLRIPTGSVAAAADDDFGSLEPEAAAAVAAAAAEPLIELDDGDNSRLSGPGRLFSPISTLGPTARKSDDDKVNSAGGFPVDDRQLRRPSGRPPPAPPERASAGLPRHFGRDPLVGSADASASARASGGASTSERMDGGAAKEETREPRGRPKPVPVLLPRGMGEAPTIGSADARPPTTAGSVWGGGMVRGAHKVETASAADRIAAFRPGTRFRVAVDKGSTGLGITVKEIRGRFFVYKLQALADGSPGAAEEAGVKAGDQLLGVEELDFETERWDMDQLVSYMGELMGVVILHMMRGFGPLPQAPKSALESGMSYGVARADNGGTAAGAVEETADGGKERGLETVQRRARRLVEVLEEEKLSKPSEAADTSRLYSQISDRARQWDTGELWLSVTDLARRPSKETLAAMARQWQPDPPPGWDESDSSEGEPSPEPGGEGSSREKWLASYGDDPGADLDKIGTALLGQPMFSSSERRRAASAAAVSSLQAAGDREGTGQYWSPWPQLVALESKAAQRGTVVPTRGLRKALNVRILGQTLPAAAAPSAGRKAPESRSAAAPAGTASYLVWVMDVESGAEWRVSRCHPEFAELKDACVGMRPSLARLDFPPWLPDVEETRGVVEGRRPRLEAYLQRLCSLLYMGPLHPSSANLAHLLQDFLGTSPRVETLGRLQRSRPERELRQALQVRAWQVFRLPPLERAVADFVREVCDPDKSRSKKAVPAEATLKRLTEMIEHLQYVITEGCFSELREMVRSSAASTAAARAVLADGGEESKGSDQTAELDRLAEEDEALELISGSVRRQVEAEVFVPVMTRIYGKLRTEGPTARLERAVARGVAEARGKPQSFHGVPISNISPSSWNSSVKLLQTVGLFTLPCDKLDALMAVAHDIPALHRMEHPGDAASNLGADDFLPIFIYVLVNSRMEDLAVQSVVLETLCDPKKMMGEAGFCVATFSAALQHLSRLAGDPTPKKSFSRFF